MKDPEITSVKGPQSQPQNGKKTLSSDPQGTSSFENELRTSTKKLEENDRDILDIINMLAGMSSAAGQSSETFKPNMTGISEKSSEGDRLSDMAKHLKISASASVEQARSTAGHSENATAANGNKQDTQQQIIAQLLAYFKSTGIPFPVMEMVSKLESLSMRPNIREISEKIIENANLIKINGKTELVLNLKPEWLGGLKINITSDNGVMNIQIFANQKTKDLIESQLEELKNFLAQADLNVGSLNVSVGEHNSGDGAADQDETDNAGMSDIPLSYMRNVPSANADPAVDSSIAMTMKQLMIYSEI